MAHHHHHDYDYKIAKQTKEDIEVAVTVPFEEYQAVYEGVFATMSQQVKIAGFRPGKAPKQKILETIGSQVASHALEHILPEVAGEILEKDKLNPITQLEYEVTNLSPEKGLEFKFRFLLYPEVKLPDFKKLKATLPTGEVDVTDEEISDVLKRLFADQAGDDFDPANLTDEMAAELKLDGVKTVADLKDKVRQRISHTKITEQQRQFEEDLLKQALAATKVTIPEKLINDRAEALVAEYTDRITNLGVKLEDFLSAQGLDLDKIKEQKQTEAEANIKTDLLLNEIAREHGLIPEAGEIDAEIAAITDEATRSRLQTNEGRRFVLSTLLQQRAFTKMVQLTTADTKK